jgi:hypothetical protein
LRRSIPAIGLAGRGLSRKARRQAADDVVSAEFVFTRQELQPVILAIRTALSCGAVALDSPQRLQDALCTLITGLGGEGTVSVRRSPAALLTPEYWQIALSRVDAPTHTALVELFRMGRS